MRQFFTIASNAFMELVRQPIYLLLTTCSAAFIIFLAAVPYFGFGDDPRMTKECVLAVMLLTGLFGAVLSAASSVAREIRSGTALAVLAKPVGRVRFLVAKYAGVAAALTLITYVNLLAVLLAGRMAYDAYGGTDFLGTGIFCSGVVLAYALAGFSNYFLRRPFVADAVFSLVGVLTAVFLVINFINKDGQAQAFGTGIDWRMVPLGVLILFALWILAGLAIACATRWEMVPTLAICSAFFLLGMMSDYLFGTRAEQGSWWASVLYAVFPNWQLFWLTDTLNGTQANPHVWSYVGHTLLYVVGYLGATLAVALALFEDRELS